MASKDEVVQNFCKRYMDAFEAQDAERVTECYDVDAAIVEIGKTVIYGRKNMREALKIFFANGPTHLKVDIKSSHMAGDFLVISGIYKSSNAQEINTGEYTQILRKHEGRYLILHEEYKETEQIKL